MNQDEKTLQPPAEFPVGMPPLVVIFFLLFAVLVGGVTTWFFQGGMYTSGVVMLIMFIPLLLISHYVLYVVPGRARIMAGTDGVLAMADPFVHKAMLAQEVKQAFLSNLKRDQDVALVEKQSGMSFGPYRAGQYLLPTGATAMVLTRQHRVLCLYDGDTYLIVGPADLDGLVAKVEEILGRPIAEVG